MTQEEKELLLKDLCARLPYGVKIKCSNHLINLSVTGILGEYVHHIPYYVGGNIEIDTTKIDEVKPYLRPMSSMTEEEKEEVKPLFSKFIDEFGKRVLVVRQNKMALYQDWLNAHHFDYRDLISKGLAIEVTKENNPYASN